MTKCLFDMEGNVWEWAAIVTDGGRYYVCGPTTDAKSFKATSVVSAASDGKDKKLGFRLVR